MNLKKFISGVSAFAIAASAFAAMAVTASAEVKSESIPVGATTTPFRNMKSYDEINGVATASTWSNNNYAYIKRDFSDLEGIDEATSVKVSFETWVFSGTPTYYGVGDGAGRDSYFNSNGTYKTTGLAMCFGYNGSAYGYTDVKTSTTTSVSNAVGKLVSASFTFDKEAGTYTYTIGNKTGTYATDISNLTYIEAATTKSGAQVGFRNITVEYTVPDAPAPVSVDLDVETQEAFTGADDSKAVIVKSVLDGETAINSLTITADGDNTKTFVNGDDFEFDTTWEGPAEIAVIVNGVSVVNAIAVN